MPNRSEVIETSQGAVQGTVENGIRVFRGIPFAKAPKGKLRFQPPVQPDKWHGVLDANEYSPSPAQPNSPMFSGDSDEDCLYLNVWAPESGQPNKPVLVWIYGGGFEGGTASSEDFSGAHLANRGDLIVVTINYRVGLLGFGLLPETQEHPATSNIGLRDSIMALEWVHENIGQFGGDSNNVTVMGQSAGAFIACALASSPSAQGLFSKLVLLSGGASRIVPADRAAAITASAMADLGIDEGGLEAVPASHLFDALKKVISSDIGVRNSSTPNALGVTLDSSMSSGVLNSHPMHVFESGDRQDIPILVGVAEAEIAAFRKWSKPESFNPSTVNDLIDEVTSWGIERSRAQSITQEYVSNAGHETVDLGLARERLLTDWIYRLPAARLVEAHAAAGGDAWALEFRGEPDKTMGHGDEMPALFDNIAKSREIEVNQSFKNDFQGSITEFARSGEPGWQKYSLETGQAKILGNESRVENAVFKDLLQLWTGVERP